MDGHANDPMKLLGRCIEQRDALLAAAEAVVYNYQEGYIRGHATVLRQIRAAIKLAREGKP